MAPGTGMEGLMELLMKETIRKKSRSFHDQYGRSVPFDVARRIRNGFQQCLPDNPFGVYVEPYTSRPDKDFPDQLLLKFWTWWASLRLVQSTNQAADQTIDLSGLKNYDVADDVGGWCGLIMLDDNWVVKEEKKGHQIDGSRRNFLLSLMQRRSRKRNVMSGRTMSQKNSRTRSGIFIMLYL
jgi:hypothetical protein